MIGSSKNNKENYRRKCFWTQEKEARVKFNLRLRTNQPSNNWAHMLQWNRLFICVPLCNIVTQCWYFDWQFAPSKLRAQISTCCVVVFVCCGGSKSGMFQVLLQYFEDRYASFYVQNPITDFTELLERVKKAVPVLKGTSDDQIKISYKDVQLGTFVNAFPCGSDSYRRVQLKVRESDSPFLLKSSRGSQPLPQETEHTKPNVAKLKLEQKTLFTPSDDWHESELASTFNWKDSQKEQLISQQQSLCDKKLAIETHLRKLELQIVEPPCVGSYNSICGNCHIPSHRSDGNKKNDKCNAPRCT